MIFDIVFTIYVVGIALFYGIFRKTKNNATPMLQILAVFWPIIIISDFGSWLVTEQNNGENGAL